MDSHLAIFVTVLLVFLICTIAIGSVAYMERDGNDHTIATWAAAAIAAALCVTVIYTSLTFWV